MECCSCSPALANASGAASTRLPLNKAFSSLQPSQAKQQKQQVYGIAAGWMRLILVQHCGGCLCSDYSDTCCKQAFAAAVVAAL
jgi:hypothetical protein